MAARLKNPVFRLTALHLLANAAILGLGYYWLGVGESRNTLVAWSLAIAVVLAAAALVTYGASFAFFGSAERGAVATAWKTAARNIVPLAAAAIAITAVYWLLSLWQDYSSKPVFTLASSLTLTFRTPIAPATVATIFNDVLLVVEWAVLPVVLLPMLAAIATRGWAGFAAIGSAWKRWWYWLAAPALLLCAMWAPFAILNWKPNMGNFGWELISFSLRAAAAYLLFAGAWLVLAFATWAGRPRATQPSTAVSP